MRKSDKIIEKTDTVAKVYYAQSVGAVDDFVTRDWQLNVMKSIKSESNKQHIHANTFANNWLWNFSLAIAAAAVAISSVVIYFENSSSTSVSEPKDNYYSAVMKHSNFNDNVVFNDYLGVDLDGE